MIVVCNTSPITNLAAIGHLELLQRLYGRIYIPEGVWEELNAGSRGWPGRDEVERAPWIKRNDVDNRPLAIALQRDLDRGEAETIAMAVELGADLGLLDEKEGRSTAGRLGLRVAGVVGVLLLSKSRAEIQVIRPLLDGLRQQAGFYLSEAVYQLALSLAGEKQPGK